VTISSGLCRLIPIFDPPIPNYRGGPNQWGRIKRGLSRYALMFDLGRAFDREAVLEATCRAMSPEDARSFLYYMHFMYARHFVDPHARQNFMREPVAVVRRFFGGNAIPFEVREDIDEN
jgi:hypothetical protein